VAANNNIQIYMLVRSVNYIYFVIYCANYHWISALHLLPPTLNLMKRVYGENRD